MLSPPENDVKRDASKLTKQDKHSSKCFKNFTDSILKEATISLLHFQGDNEALKLANRNSEKKDIHSLLHRSPLKIAKDFAFISEDAMQSNAVLSVK